jgi:hypothetical protein
MSGPERLPSRGPRCAIEGDRGRALDVFGRARIGLKSSANGSAASRRSERNIRKELCTLLNLLGWSGASPYHGVRARSPSGSAHVAAGASIDPDQFTFFDKQRDLNHFTGL